MPTLPWAEQQEPCLEPAGLHRDLGEDLALEENKLISDNNLREMERDSILINQHQFILEQIKESQAVLDDYDQMSHLCPNSHLNSRESKTATFTLTNIVPQDCTLNTGQWSAYESRTMPVRTKGCIETCVVSGAVPGTTQVTNGRVNVTSHIWSAACCLVGTNPTRACGAIAENERNKNKMKNLELLELENRLTKLYERGGLIKQTYHKYMDEEASIIKDYNITSEKIGKSQAIDQDYRGALGLDRGHLCPSGHQTGNDSKWATFTLTNIVPQDNDFNQGTWHDYEEVTMPQKTQGCDTTYVLASCLWLGHSEVVKSFTRCPQFFYARTPPRDSLRPRNAARICQVYGNKYRFATLYDRNRRIPVYSAYIYEPGPGDRSDSWFVEPQ
ncbi:hypothetical protein IHE44_0012654, partial [Lamprotornis superbus]